MERALSCLLTSEVDLQQIATTDDNLIAICNSFSMHEAVSASAQQQLQSMNVLMLVWSQ